jgi:hypothetical protein
MQMGTHDLQQMTASRVVQIPSYGIYRQGMEEVDPAARLDGVEESLGRGYMWGTYRPQSSCTQAKLCHMKALYGPCFSTAAIYRATVIGWQLSRFWQWGGTRCNLIARRSVHLYISAHSLCEPGRWSAQQLSAEVRQVARRTAGHCVMRWTSRGL